MRDKFKFGDNVWDLRYGWGVVEKIDVDLSYPVVVRFRTDVLTIHFTHDGKRYCSDNSRTLFFEEIEIPASAYIRPRRRVELNKKYFYINSIGNAMAGVESEHPMNLDRFNIGNYFETIEDAKDSKFYKVFNGEEI